MLVMLDTPQGAFYGSQVSAPIFRDTLQQILVAKGIQPAASEGLPSFEEMNAVGQKDEKKPKQLPVLQRMPDGKSSCRISKAWICAILSTCWSRTS